MRACTAYRVGINPNTLLFSFCGKDFYCLPIFLYVYNIFQGKRVDFHLKLLTSWMWATGHTWCSGSCKITLQFWCSKLYLYKKTKFSWILHIFKASPTSYQDKQGSNVIPILTNPQNKTSCKNDIKGNLFNHIQWWMAWFILYLLINFKK